MSQSDGAALVLFSGGQDSATCLAWALDRYARVETSAFDYGQRHHVELEVRRAFIDGLRARFPVWASRLGGDHVIDLAALGQVSETALTREVAIQQAESGLPTTFVPGRNLLFLTFAAALGYRRGIDVLVGGMSETDYSGYPDCRAETMRAMQAALSLGMDRPIRIVTPLMQLDKAETWALAHALGGAPLIELIRADTHTCYLGDRGTLHEWGYGCGNCPACELRRRGYERWRGQLSGRGVAP
ncbi:MAG: 7-cyano-7-deazaguanine synthase QueC [Casimicrobiaceae bacterium]